MALNVDIQGNSNSVGIFGVDINVFGSGNAVGQFNGQIGIYNSNLNTTYDFCSGITIINSNNCYVNSGLTNVVIVGGDGITATTSNTGYGLISGGTAGTDVYITGATFSAGTLELQNSTGGTVTATGNFPWEFVETGQTIGATSINLCNYNVGPNPGCYSVKAYITAINDNFDTVFASDIYQVVKYTGSTFFEIGKQIGTTTSEFSTAVSSNINFTSSANTIFVNLIGQAGQTINWKANLKIY